MPRVKVRLTTQRLIEIEQRERELAFRERFRAADNMRAGAALVYATGNSAEGRRMMLEADKLPRKIQCEIDREAQAGTDWSDPARFLTKLPQPVVRAVPQEKPIRVFSFDEEV